MTLLAMVRGFQVPDVGRPSGYGCSVHGLGVQLEPQKIYFRIYSSSLWAMRPAAPDFKITKIDLRFISINMLGTEEALDGVPFLLKCGS